MGVKSTVYLTRADAISRIDSCFEDLDDTGLSRVLEALEDELSRMDGHGDESSYNYQVADDDRVELAPNGFEEYMYLWNRSLREAETALRSAKTYRKIVESLRCGVPDESR
jgi:hypothetical protein